MEQHDKQHLQNIDKVEIHNHNHVDLADVLSQLHIVRMQNKQILQLILSDDEDEKERTEIMRKLNKLLADLKKTV